MYFGEGEPIVAIAPEDGEATGFIPVVEDAIEQVQEQIGPIADSDRVRGIFLWMGTIVLGGYVGGPFGAVAGGVIGLAFGKDKK